MILILGAESSGKSAYAKSLGYAESDIALDIHERVFQAPELAAELLGELASRQVITCNEVGSGVIPANRHEREAREAVGRLCVKLAQRAERVVRMSAGIPVTIKGE